MLLLRWEREGFSCCFAHRTCWKKRVPAGPYRGTKLHVAFHTDHLQVFNRTAIVVLLLLLLVPSNVRHAGTVSALQYWEQHKEKRHTGQRRKLHTSLMGKSMTCNHQHPSNHIQVFLHSDFLIKMLYERHMFATLQTTAHVPPSYIWSSKQCMAKSTKLWTFNYAVFSSLLLLHSPLIPKYSPQHHLL
jgi:hypothetical protein